MVPSLFKIGAALAWAVVPLALPGCVDRSGVHVVPTAALPCPPWVEFPSDAHSNENSTYLGCANSANLVTMMANPADLLEGETLGPASGERESLGVDLYNQGKIDAKKNAGTAAPTIIMPTATGDTSR